MKHCVITGASSGLGLETAKYLADNGWKLTLLCRNPTKSEKAIRYIKKGNDSSVELIITDLTLMESVKSAATKLLNLGNQIDVLINNAGCLTQGREISKEGWEYSYTINYLAPFLLTQLLKPLFYEKSRIINVNSSGHTNQQLKIPELNHQSGYQAYATSKQANALMIIELAKRNKMAFCADPGAIGSGFGGNLSLPIKWMMKLVKPFCEVQNRQLKLLFI